MKKIKRYLFLLHRWLGIAVCLFIALWFASGIIMMYVEYPELTETERLESLPVLIPDDIKLNLGDALARVGTDADFFTARLSSVAGRPVYLLENPTGFHRVFADTGETFNAIDSKLALATASIFSGMRDELVYAGQIHDDQWTASSSLHSHRPLHKVLVDNAQGSVLYISSRTGQVVRDTHRNERFWNWLGSTIHWLYPIQLRRHSELWSKVVIYLSLAALFSVVTGALVGIMRLRLRRRYKSGSVSPYRSIGKWHHLLGLTCLIFIFTFIFSGFMSMSPWGLFSSEKAAAPQIERFTGSEMMIVSNFPSLNFTLWPKGIKEVEWLTIDNEGYLALSKASDEQLVLMHDGQKPASQPPSLLAQIEKNLPAMLPESIVVSVKTLHEYDNYYYSRHNRYRPLPVYRVSFDDNESTWYHIDLNTGKVISRHTDNSRIMRWLYNGLHSLDFIFLVNRGLLWDLTVILLSLLGLSFSVTSLIIAWRRFSKVF